MKHSFINLLRDPDSVLFQYEDSGIRFEEPDGREEQIAKLEYKVNGNSGAIIVYPCDKPIKRVKLRWRGDMSDAQLILGDAFERNYSYSFGLHLCPSARCLGISTFLTVSDLTASALKQAPMPFVISSVTSAELPFGLI